MDLSNHKNKMINFVCKKYIMLDSKGDIKFKSHINDAIRQGIISNEDALSISLELMHGIKNYGYTESDVLSELENLILKVSEYNLDENETIKNSVLFFKDYSYENFVLFEYIGSLSLSDSENLDNNSVKNKPRDIKKYFNNFSYEELCYILDINPDLNFIKDKVLKKQIANEFSKYDFDVNRIDNASSKDIKKYLEYLVEKSNENQSNEVIDKLKKQNQENQDTRNKQYKNKQINLNENTFEKIKSKKNVNVNSNYTKKYDEKGLNVIETTNFKKDISNHDFDDLINKIKLFNHKKLQSMISLKEDYSQVYKYICSENIDAINNDIKRFRYFYENFDKIEDSIKIIDKIKEKESLLKKFHSKLNNKSFSDSDSKYVIMEFEELYEIANLIKNYPYCLKDKIIDEFDNLDYFIENYEKLLDTYDFKTDEYIEKMNLIVKINSFNDKNLQDMVSSKKEYSEIYQEVSGNIDKFLNNSDVLGFIDVYRDCESAIDLINKIKQNKDLINSFCAEINSGEYLSNYKRYMLIVEYKEFYDLACQIYDISEWFEHVIFEQFDTFERFMAYYDGLINYNYFQDEEMRNINVIRCINENYIENEINNNKSFFKDVKDENKLRAIVTDEDNVKVVAGAGAGKTFIIQKRINYLIKKGIDPKKILCLCYTGKGAHDLKEKINNDDVNIFTFHGFCREVSEKCDKYLPTDDKLLDDVINNYIRKVIDDDEKLNEILEYFNYYVKNPTEREFDSMEEYEEFKNGFGLKTLRNKYDFYNGYQKQSYKGEVVRSLEELVIANFLFMHNINYIYEDTYEHEFLTPIIHNFFASYNYFCLNRDLNTDFVNLKQFNDFEKSLNKYQPDFYLPDKEIYIEHFGVARDNIAHWLKGDDQKKYTESMEFKLRLHKLYNTNLITTFSYFMTEGILLDELRESLSDYYELHERDKKEIFNIILNNNRSEDLKHFKRLIKSFINIFEAKNLPKSKLNDFKKDNLSQKNIYLKRKHELFLNIVSEIYEDYDLWNQKGGLYYNREVTNALNLITTGEFKECYDYIFIDEYQDINYVRCKLLQELQKINNSKLFVVGDDWQSIYGFNGSEVKLFVDFDKYFPNSETIKISENRRNCQVLIDISSEFILQNENQEEKELEYYKKNKFVNSNPVRLVPYDKKENKILYVEKVIQDIIKSNPKKKLEILLLGRKNKDINFLINNRLFKQVYGDKKYKIIEYSKNSDITIYFMSIHQSKGLEKDEVIILNFENYDYGFPNQVDDDSVLKFIKEKEDYLFAEERRLLYVALTRTRNNAYLIYPSSNYSVFIEELQKDFKLEDSIYEIDSKDLNGLYEFNDFYSGNDYKMWYPNSIPIPIGGIDYFFKVKDTGFLNVIELELFIWYEYLREYDDPLEKAFKKLIGFNKGSKTNLKIKSLKNKNKIRNSDIIVFVNDKKCNFTISGIGQKSIRITKEIFFANEKIKNEYVNDILRKNIISNEDLEKLLDI